MNVNVTDNNYTVKVIADYRRQQLDFEKSMMKVKFPNLSHLKTVTV